MKERIRTTPRMHRHPADRKHVMRPSEIAISNYRSIRRLSIPIHPLSVFVGENGVGKSNLYKSLSLLRDAATGQITRTIADEGGLNSVCWSGLRKRGEDGRLRLSATFDSMRYFIELGFPSPLQAAFSGEPMIKTEMIEATRGKRTVKLMERVNSLISVRGESGAWIAHKDAVLPSETALAAFSDGKQCPEIDLIRNAMLGWRFYHDFRTDPASPIRKPCLAIATPSLSADGIDLAATLATLYVIREDANDLQDAIQDAFPGAELRAWEENGRCEFDLQLPDMPRPFRAHETIRWDAQIHLPARGVHGLPAAAVHRAERTRDQPASVAARAARPAHRQGIAPRRHLDCHPFGTVDGRIAKREFGPASPGDQVERRHGHRGPDHRR
ncbi:putative ATPase [Bradyrhizobium sp. F1.2.2]